MQFHKVMAPIFARLGVKLITRNMSQGGLGTIQASFGMRSIYGHDIDLLLWDAGMTEGAGAHQELFFRQGILGGDRVPIVMGMGMAAPIMEMLYQYADADVGNYGSGSEGIPITKSAEQALELPYATRYLNCAPEAKDFCAVQPRFCTVCWIDPIGDGSIIPPTPQKEQFSDNSNFHPGWRELQVRGRNLSMMVLRALQDAIELWNENIAGTSAEATRVPCKLVPPFSHIHLFLSFCFVPAGGPPLDESFWHVTEYYENIRSKMQNLPKDLGLCYGAFEGMKVPSRVCHTPMNVRRIFKIMQPRIVSITVHSLKPDNF